LREKAEGIVTVQTEVGQRVDGLETESDCAACGRATGRGRELKTTMRLKASTLRSCQALLAA